MPQLNLKPNHKAIRDYYAMLQQYAQHDIAHEGAVSNPFAFLLDACAKQADATLIPQYPMRTPKGSRRFLGFCRRRHGISRPPHQLRIGAEVRQVGTHRNARAADRLAR